MEELNSMKKTKISLMEEIKIKDEKLEELQKNNISIEERMNIKSTETKNKELEKILKVLDQSINNITNDNKQLELEVKILKNDVKNANISVQNYKEREKSLIELTKEKNPDLVEQLLKNFSKHDDDVVINSNEHTKEKSNFARLFHRKSFSEKTTENENSSPNKEVKDTPKLNKTFSMIKNRTSIFGGNRETKQHIPVIIHESNLKKDSSFSVTDKDQKKN
jgi:hypothetical protein